MVALLRSVLTSLRDLTPIVITIVIFQVGVLKQGFPDAAGLLAGMVAVVLGLTLFVRGLEMGLFPLGETVAHGLARKGGLWWLLTFAFVLGSGSTIAEPALTAVAGQAALVVSDGGLILDNEQGRATFALTLRLTVGVAVGVSLVVGVLRILKGWPLHLMMIGGYALVVVMTAFAPREFIGIAYDSGGVTTSTVTVPLVTALGIGLASSIRGRNPMVDGFGLIAFASLTPMIFVMGLGLVIA